MTSTDLARAAPPHEGMLAIWHDIEPGHAGAVREWYAREHHFERLSIPGFLEARRFDRVGGRGAQVLGTYWVESPQVLRGPDYRARVESPTPWTRRMMPSFRSMSRTVCSIAARAGHARGGHLAALASATGEPGDPTAICAALAALGGVLQATVLIADREHAATPASTEMALRGMPDASVAWAVLVDVEGPQPAEAALEAAWKLTGCTEAAQHAVYRLAFSAHNFS